MDELNNQNMLQVGTILHGTYKIESYLSSGGFGNTYLAKNIEFDETYAIKEFFVKGVCQRDGNSTTISVSNAENTNSFEQQREKFKKEARRLRSLSNPHIVKVYDLFEENGTAYYVMDYVDGENLSVRLKRTNAPLAESEVRNYLNQILDGLEAIHNEGMFHLDIKPANIMVDSHNVVKLIDFGASKQQSTVGGATMSTGISYTNGYAPSEQMAQSYDKFGPWTDFYALGATVYKLLTNQDPPSVNDLSEDETEDKHLALPMPGVSDEMKKLVVWMMQVNRLKRPQCVGDIRNFQQQFSSTACSNSEDTAYANPATADEKTIFVTSTEKLKDNKNKYLVLKIIGSGLIVLVFIFMISLSNGHNQLTGIQSAKSTDSVNYTKTIIDKIVANMVYVEGGSFCMGDTDKGVEKYLNSLPAHSVTVSDFYISKYEVTQREWKALMGNNPSNHKNDDAPVDCVSWYDCQKYVQKLSEASNRVFRLPTEAEWEYAARGGNKSEGYIYAGSNNINNVAWYFKGEWDDPHPVGKLLPNELGLYDMTGNVCEWCYDWYAKFSAVPQVDPVGPSEGKEKVVRSSDVGVGIDCSRISGRFNDVPGKKTIGLGFRVVMLK